MLREFISDKGPALIGIGSTLFFFVIFAGVTLRVLTRRSGSYDEVARLPLDDAPHAGGAGKPAGTDESRTGGR